MNLREASLGVPGAGAASAMEFAKDLWVVLADVPAAVYGPGRLEPALGDLDWVSRVALAHERVVEQCLRRRDVVVLPMKLFTLFSSRDRAMESLRRDRQAIARAARRIAGCEEWGVRVTRLNAEQPALALQAATGRAFLEARRQARDADQLAAARAADGAERTFRALARLARDSRRRDAPRAPGVVPPLLDAAFLVNTGKRRSFGAAVRQAAVAGRKAGVRVDLTGPWPAYTFVAGEETGP